MKKNTWCFPAVIILDCTIVLSGCEMILPSTVYESTPTRISYDLSYGYEVNCSGQGSYKILYRCGIPEVLTGAVTYDLLFPSEYQRKMLVNNTFIEWNISRDYNRTYMVGLTAHIDVDSYIFSDLNGKNAATIQELQEKSPQVVHSFTNLQGNETIRYIEPSNSDIFAVAKIVQNTAQTNNSFLVAKALFTWLKEHVSYQTHPLESDVRPAAITFSKKNGDCDDLSFLYVSLCRACQIPARFIRGYLVTNESGNYSAIAHAWVEVFVGNSLGIDGWIPVECACRTQSIDSDVLQNFGAETAFHLRVFTDDGSNASLELSLSGISYTHMLSRVITVHPFVMISNYKNLESKKLVINAENTRLYE